MNSFALSLLLSISPPAPNPGDDVRVSEEKPDPKFFLNLTPGLLESFSPVTGDHYGLYLMVSTDFLIPVGKHGTTLIFSPDSRSVNSAPRVSSGVPWRGSSWTK